MSDAREERRREIADVLLRAALAGDAVLILPPTCHVNFDQAALGVKEALTTLDGTSALRVDPAAIAKLAPHPILGP